MANAPTFLNHSGVAEDAQGVFVVDADGNIVTDFGGTGGGGSATEATMLTIATKLDTVITNTDRTADGVEAVTPVSVVGEIAHDAADSGAPLKIGGKAVSALSALTLPASADRVNAAFDLDGALIVREGGAIGDRVSARATNTDGTSTACIAAQAAGIAVNLSDVTLSNSHATQFCTVDILDGATIKWTFPVPPLGGVTHRFATPLKGTAATAWNFDPSAATTTITCSMAGRLTKL